MLLKHKTNNLNKIYKIISKGLPSSIFVILGLNFFKKMVLSKLIHVYCIEKKKTISSVISVIDFKNYFLINKKIIVYLILRPFLLLKFFFKLIQASQKNSKIKINPNYLHLLHLVILKEQFMNISIKKKDVLFNKFYKKILKKHKAKTIFLCFDKKNKIAKRYYKRNNFKFYVKKGNFFYYRKTFK